MYHYRNTRSGRVVSRSQRLDVIPAGWVAHDPVPAPAVAPPEWATCGNAFCADLLPHPVHAEPLPAWLLAGLTPSADEQPVDEQPAGALVAGDAAQAELPPEVPASANSDAPPSELPDLSKKPTRKAAAK